MDGDKAGFLRTHRSLIQTAGRAARNAEGRVVLYADKITDAIQKLLDETEYRRKKQIAYNEAHGMTPQTVVKAIKAHEDIFGDALGNRGDYEKMDENLSMVSEDEKEYMTEEQIKDRIKAIRKQMEKAAKELDFVEAAALRDQMYTLQAVLKERY